jgi:hypothetical protein
MITVLLPHPGSLPFLDFSYWLDNLRLLLAPQLGLFFLDGLLEFVIHDLETMSRRQLDAKLAECLVASILF